MKAPEFTEYRNLWQDQRDGKFPGGRNARLKELESKLPEAVKLRARAEAGAQRRVEYYKTANFTRLGRPKLAEVKESLARQLKEELAGKKIATRVTGPSLLGILRDERFKTQHEVSSESIGVLYNPETRRLIEAAQYGLPETGFDPKKRPVIGYVAVNGTGDFVEGQELSAYGTIEVIFKDRVRTRTTAQVDDSLNRRTEGRPSPVDDPSWESALVQPEGIQDFTSDSFRRYYFVEAQVHGGVSVSDIEEVVFQEQPTAALVGELEAKGISWRVVKAK